MKLTAELIEGLAGVFLSPRYDQPRPTPEFHRDGWRRYCSDLPSCATAAPRGHAKSTAFTHDFILANVLFKVEDYVIILSASEEMAIEHLGDIATELRENDELRQHFHIKDFLVDQKTDIIVSRTDDSQFRIRARGAEQKIRGMKWRGKRPGLIVGDDLEDDEQVENKERRKKFRRWFFRAAKQALRDGGRIRVHGTILHKDSLLMHLMVNPSWDSKLYKAHRSSSDFRDMLWPEMFSETKLKAIKAELMKENDVSGYAQEYLNDPRDDENSYLLVEQFVPMMEADRDTFMVLAVGCDFAVSKADVNNRTSFTIGGKRADNIRQVIDQRASRWHTKEWLEEMFLIEDTYHPRYWFVEDGIIWKAVEPFILEEMRLRDVYLNIIPKFPVKDKGTRGQGFRKQMKARVWRYDAEASWFPEYKEELLDFNPETEALLDDQFDSTVTLARGLDEVNVEVEDAMTEEEIQFEYQSNLLRAPGSGGRSLVTGY